MKIKVVVTDLRDASTYEYVVESWETLETIRNLMSSGGPKISPDQQFFYVGDELMNITIPADQLRKRARAAGLLVGNDQAKVAPVFLYVGTSPIDFGDPFQEEIIRKLRSTKGETRAICLRVRIGDTDNKFNFSVDSGSITVDDFKNMALKKMGPSSLTGLTKDNLLLYVRNVQPGRPLAGDEIRAVFEEPEVNLDALKKRDPVTIVVKVKKCGLFKKEQYDLEIEDHELVEDLKSKVCELLQTSRSPAVVKRNFTPENINFSVAGTSTGGSSAEKLQRKYGVPCDRLWLRAFNVKDGTSVVVNV